MTATQWSGVWLSEVPLDLNEGADGEVLLRVHRDLSDEELDAYEWLEDGKPYPEWLVPSALLNGRCRIEVDATGWEQ